ncbi:MAG: hypothetical protein NUV80_07460 [Candidatus Berkelbacteria bacterium]|nr:hypothetical protein [Candidatus Berkelbacteria bacterium]
MTTIAANREQMVSDSRVSIAEKGFAYPATKIIKTNGMLVGASGEGGDCTRFLDWARKGFKEKDMPKWKMPHYDEDEIVGIILKADGIYLWTQGGPEPERVEAEFFAIGSGGKAARVALNMGLSPEEAVEKAIEVDSIWSGLPLQILHLKD